MATTLDDLAAGLQGFFTDRLGLAPADVPGSALLVFDSLGTPLDPAEFIGSGTNSAQDLLSHQRAAQLADQIPAANALSNGWYLPRGGSRVSRWYEAILDSAAAASSDEPQTQAFEHLLHNARRHFDDNKLGLATGTAVGGETGTAAAAGAHDVYYATQMSPVAWFAADAPSWAHYDLNAVDKPAAALPKSSPLPTPAFRLRVASDLQSVALNSFVATAARTNTDPAVVVDPPPNVAAVTDLAEASPFSTRVARRFSAIKTLGRETNLTPLSDTAIDPQLAPMVVGQDLLLRQPEQPIDTDKRTSGIKFVNIDKAQLLAATESKPSAADSFHVSFDYCLVRFDRPWFDDVLMHAKGWTVFGYDPGAIASGSASAPSGEITLLTNGMLVIRNLSITANWSGDDRTTLSQSTSLGPFCVAGGNFDSDSGTLSRAGMQAIAWLCEVPPQLPPQPITESKATPGG